MAAAKTPEEQLEDLKSEMLLREAQEEVRREQIEKLWKQYQPYIIGTAALILAGIGGYQILKNHAESLARQSGDQLSKALQAVEEGKSAEAQALFKELEGSGGANFAALARMNLADAALKAGNAKDAIAQLNALAGDPSASSHLRDVARIKAAALGVDNADWTDVSNQLTSVANGDGPWRFAARELIGLAAFKAGKLSEAKQAFQQIIADGKTPPSLSQRAQVVMTRIVATELNAKFPPPVTPPALAPQTTGPTTGTPTVSVPAPQPVQGTAATKTP